MSNRAPTELPRLVDVGLIPALNLLTALVISGIVIWILGEDPFEAMGLMVSGAFELLCTQYPADTFIFMGDSAGGGLALAFAQKLVNEEHHKLPVQLILLSPWLDLSLSNTDIKNLEHSDHILTVEMLRHAAKSYSGGDDPDHYLLSPINGELADLPPTIVFYGSEELFAADCRKFRSMIENINHTSIFREYPGMPHDWALFPFPESDRTVDEICAFIDNK